MGARLDSSSMKATSQRSQGVLVGGALCGLFLGILFACEPPPAVGDSGGGCRFGVPACNEGLICFQGTCTPVDDAPPTYPTEEDFSAEVQITKTTLEADGADTLTFAFDLVDRSTGRPTTLPGVLIRTEPPRAGIVTPQKLPLDDGHGVVRVRACDPQYQACPKQFTIVAATIEYPTEPVLRSPVITYTGLPEPLTPDAGIAAGLDAGVSTLDAGEIRPEVPTVAEMRGALDELQRETTDCDAATQGYPDGPERDIAKTVCNACAPVWRNGGAAMVTAMLRPDVEAGTLVPTDVRTVTLRDIESSASVGEVFPRVLTAKVRAGGRAPNALAIRTPYKYSNSVGNTGCTGANLEIDGLDDWFGLRCERLGVPFCGRFESSRDSRRDLLLWLLDIAPIECFDEDGQVINAGPTDARPRLFMCVNTVIP